MSTTDTIVQENATGVPNCTGAVAILSAGIGTSAVGFFSIAADKSAFLKNIAFIYIPTDSLSRVSTGAILVWVAVWAILDWRWRKRTVSVSRINLIRTIWPEPIIDVPARRRLVFIG